jgi:hypothetical protein
VLEPDWQLNAVFRLYNAWFWFEISLLRFKGSGGAERGILNGVRGWRAGSGSKV